MRSFLDWLLPWRRGGVRPHDAAHALITLAVLVALLLTSFGAGYHTAQTRYTAAYFRSHYANPGLRAPAPSSRTTVAPVAPAGTAAVSINLAHYPAVGDQGQQGACAAWASAWALSYDYRMAHLTTHPGIRFSPEWLYTWYADKYAAGQDEGSWPIQDLEMVPSIGVPQFSRYPAPQAIADPFPTPAQLPAAYRNAARFIEPLSVETLYDGTPGVGVYDAIYAAVAAGQPAIIALNVTGSWDNATQTHGDIWYTGPETSRGGHAVDALAVDPSHIMPDGSPGVLIQNQWGTGYGLRGRVWVSENWLSANSWAVLALQGVS